MRDAGDVALVDEMKVWEAVKSKSSIDVEFSKQATSIRRDYLKRLLVITGGGLIKLLPMLSGF